MSTHKICFGLKIKQKKKKKILIIVPLFGAMTIYIELCFIL